MTNRETTNKSWVVKFYQQRRELDKPEAILLEKLSGQLAEANFLDIGIGGGRTTFHIASRVKKYTGVDYAEEMVKVCEEEFKAPNISFYTMDAREMSQFENEIFDIIMFSFNGIDYVDFEGRIAVMKEVYRILKPGGIFIVSTHNSRKLDSLYSFKYNKNPWAWLKKIKTTFQLRKVNGPKSNFAGKDFFAIKDGAEDFGLDVGYIKPEYFINQMKESGFTLNCMLHYKSGNSINLNDLSSNIDPWIYYSFTKQNNIN